MKLPFISVLISVLFFASCQKGIEPFSPDNGGNDSTGNGGNDTTGTTVDTYLPLTKDTWWKYSDSGLTNDTAIYTVLGIKETINGKEYDKLSVEKSSGTSLIYFAVVGHDYYEYASGASSGGTPAMFEILMLNDTASVGYQWVSDIGLVNGIQGYFFGTITEKDISITVHGKLYSHVIHANLVLQYDIPGSGLTTYGIYDLYFAKGIGIIKNDALLTSSGFTLQDKLDMIDYSIK